MAQKKPELRLPSKPLRLAATHGWSDRPDRKVLVLDRGAVRLDYPADWVVDSAGDCVKLRDREPPDEECTLGASYHHWPALPGLHPALRVAALVETAMADDERFTARDPVHDEPGFGLELAWGQGRFIDADREALSRVCIARRGEIQALVTLDFWASDLERCDALWHEILASIQIAERVED